MLLRSRLDCGRHQDRLDDLALRIVLRELPGADAAKARRFLGGGPIGDDHGERAGVFRAVFVVEFDGDITRNEGVALLAIAARGLEVEGR